MKKFELQPNLEEERVLLQPLKQDDFDQLYAVASDPLVWEQHPNKDRYKKEVFEVFFQGAMESGGALLALEKNTFKVMGTSRYYDFSAEDDSICIGYTFLGRDYWGRGYNPSMKRLMLGHAFRFVKNVLFHVGSENIRSQMAMGNIGARKIGEKEMSYFGETKINLNHIYRISKADWS